MNRFGVEICTNQDGVKWAQEVCDDFPVREDIIAVLFKHGYRAANIEIDFDNLVRKWWWRCDIFPLTDF